MEIARYDRAMEWLLSFLAGAAEAEGYWALLRFTGLPKLAGWIIRRRAGTVKMRDFAFYPDKEQLRRAAGSFANSLKGAKHVDALWVAGQEYYNTNEDLSMIKRIILPNPNIPELLTYAKSANEEDTLQNLIKATARRAVKNNIKVRYTKHFIGHSMNLVDTDQAHGWVQAEFVMPYLLPQKRPAVKIYRRRSPEVVREMQRVFNEIWENAQPVNQSGEGFESQPPQDIGEETQP